MKNLEVSHTQECGLGIPSSVVNMAAAMGNGYRCQVFQKYEVGEYRRGNCTQSNEVLGIRSNTTNTTSIPVVLVA